MKHLLIILSFLLLNFPTAVYSAQNRVALVIGNGAYRDAGAGRDLGIRGRWRDTSNISQKSPTV
tara:strand:+ start:10 stop:201 length:192 start_codon:yes stop_codon:yes gene_type:complete